MIGRVVGWSLLVMAFGRHAATAAVPGGDDRRPGDRTRGDDDGQDESRTAEIRITKRLNGHVGSSPF